jgi:hypothetical protein
MLRPPTPVAGFAVPLLFQLPAVVRFFAQNNRAVRSTAIAMVSVFDVFPMFPAGLS